MATQRSKPFTITWPFTAKTAEDIDQTFDIIFKQVQLNAPRSGLLPVSLGGTGLGVFVRGDILFASTTTTIDGLHDVAPGNVLLSGGVNAAPSYGKVGLATHVSGILPRANGGTGLDASGVTDGQLLIGRTSDNSFQLATLTAGANISITNGPGEITIAATAGSSPLLDGSTHTDTAAYTVTRGSLIVGNSTPLWDGLAIGPPNRVLTSNGTDPSWAQVDLAATVTGVLPVANGGTSFSTYAQGDIIYASAVNTLAKLPKDTNVSRYLSNTGASNAPAWAQVNVTNGVTGTLPVGNGGTAVTSWAIGDLVVAFTSSQLGPVPMEAAGNVLISTGALGVPQWNKADLTTHVTNKLPIGNGGTNATNAGDARTNLAVPGKAVTETISGTWTFTAAMAVTNNVVVSNTFGVFVENTAGTDVPIGRVTAGNQLEIGLDNSASMNNTVLNAGQSIVFRTNSADRVSVSNVGHVTPAADNAQTCGNASFRWSLVRGVTITPGDLLFDNGWVITEANNYGIAAPGLVVLDANDDLIAYLAQNGNLYLGGITLPLALLPGGFTKTTIEQRTGYPRPTP